MLPLCRAPPTPNWYGSLRCLAPLWHSCCGSISRDFQSAVAGIWLLFVEFHKQNHWHSKWFLLFLWFWSNFVYFIDFRTLLLIFKYLYGFRLVCLYFQKLLLICCWFSGSWVAGSPQTGLIYIYIYIHIYIYIWLFIWYVYTRRYTSTLLVYQKTKISVPSCDSMGEFLETWFPQERGTQNYWLLVY